VTAEQTALGFDARSWAEKRADEYRASLAAQAKRTGQGRAVNADPEGFERASRAIAALAALGSPFDASDVRAWAGPFESPNVLGASFSRARKAGLIRASGVTTAKAASRHGGLVRLWEGVP
jgi:hypothetical protein